MRPCAGRESVDLFTYLLTSRPTVLYTNAAKRITVGLLVQLTKALKFIVCYVKNRRLVLYLSFATNPVLSNFIKRKINTI